MVEDALAPFLGTWTLMMAAMMLPSAAPMILLHRLGAERPGRVHREVRSAVFVSGYLLVWGSVGIAVWVLSRIADQIVPPEARAFAVAGVLLAAGVYQLTPLKTTCLRACRTPMDFLLTHWYPGLAGSLRLGVEHGLYCFGCCWALMAVFVAAGSMSLFWALIIAAVVFIEKVASRGVAFGRTLGVGLIVVAAVLALRPELAGAMNER